MAPPRQKAQTPPPADPLADLREPEAPAALPGEQNGPQDASGDEPEGEAPPEEVQAFLAAYVADQGNLKAAVDALHGDRIARGVLHAGGTCACTHLARVVLTAAKPAAIQVNNPEGDEEEETEKP